MKKIYLVFLIMVSSCSSTHKSKVAAEKRHPLNIDTIEEIAERVRKTVNSQIGEGMNTGVVIGIYLQGKSKFLYFGETKKGNKTPPDENTIFEIGSLTKTFTGLLLAEEIESKKVKETDTISSFQKKWIGQSAGDITLLELVTHRSGLPRIPCNLDLKDSEQPYVLYTEDKLIDFLKDKNLKEHPDCILEPHPTKKANYSNLGFGLLGYVLALKEKTPYIDLLKKKILKPLTMEDTTYDLSHEQMKRIAQGYDEKGKPVPMWKQSTMMGAGALRSTASDLFVFAQSYIHPDTTPIAAAILKTTELQFAWMLNQNGSFWHNGMTGGYASYMKIYPKKDFAIFYLTNSAKELKCLSEAVSDSPCK